MNSDVRDILEINQSNPGSKVVKKKKIKRLIEPIKRPQGVHREVWGLICKDDRDQPPIIPAEEPKAIYQHQRAKLRYGVRKWHFIEFTNPARNDQAKFSHWRCVNDDPNKEYPFAKFNKKIKLVNYTDQEYNQYLNGDDSWTKAETDHLMELCKRYDLRFFVIHDRWDPSIFPSAKKRTIDEIKDRYYKVISIMQKAKFGEDTQTYVFDLEHEQKRREQLEKLFNRTKEQIKEESYLIEELKKIEFNKKERERKQQDVNKLLTAVVDYESQAQNQAKLIGNKSRGSIESRGSIGASNSQLNSSLNSSGNNKRLKNRKYSTHSNSDIKGASAGASGQKAGSANNSANNSLNNSTDATHQSPSTDKNRKSLIFKAVVESTGIKFPDAKLAGVSLRSFKMKLPPSVGTKKTKAIEQLLDELQIEQRPIATASVSEQFNELRSDIVLLYELQQALTNCDYEYQTFKHRYESIAPPGKNIDFEQLESSLSASTSSQFNSVSATNTPQKRISEMFDVSVTQSGPLERRRKAALNQTNILKRLRGRNAS